MAISLASSTPDPRSGPEEQFISALIESGSYTPADYAVSDEAIRAYRTVHEFCLNYQKHSGSAPPSHLVESKFPSFTFTEGLSAHWAAAELALAEKSRHLHKTINRLATATTEEAYDEAYGIMAEASRHRRTDIRAGVDALDFDLLDAQSDTSVCPVPPDGYLARLTGGHPVGQLWLIAALWGVGKSWVLLHHAVAALAGGWNVVFFSLEMSPEEILQRLHKIALASMGHSHALMTTQEQREALTRWYEGCGSFTVYGPEHGRVDATVIAGAVKEPRTLVCVDYVGRMYSNAGSPATEDYKSVANISRELCEVASTSAVPVLAAVQLNRQGSVAGSMELERDPHIIIETARVSENCNSIRINTIKKSRSTASTGRWFSMFDAENGRFHDITKDEATEMRAEEESV